MTTAEYWGLLATLVTALATIGVPVVLASRAASQATVRVAERIEGILRDFPPHRHVGDNVIYAQGFEPTKIEELDLLRKGAKA